MRVEIDTRQLATRPDLSDKARHWVGGGVICSSGQSGVGTIRRTFRKTDEV